MEEQSFFSIRKEVFPFLNVSFYLNNIKPIYSLTVGNNSEQDFWQIEIAIKSDLPVIENFSYILDVIPAKKSVNIPLDNLSLNRSFLDKLSETEKLNISISIIQNENVLLVDKTQIDVHPIEYFGGIQVLPELISTYVTPNHSYVHSLKRKALEELEKQRLNVSFEGYQSNNPERILQMMSAIYSAIQSEDIVYHTLPPGYEHFGQRLRLLNTIQHEKFGNCIDISLLFAACFESIGLNPILIFTHGHAFIGCWLHDDKFSETVNDDKTAITKRLSKGIREIAALEATTICKGNNICFSDALNIGEAQLVEKEDFIISIDIKRARTAQIRPLPLLVSQEDIQLDESEIGKRQKENMDKDFQIGTIYQDDFSYIETQTTKLKIWERKLLDLSLRNNLISLSITKGMLQLVDIDISHLEDVLSEGKSFTIVPDPRATVLRKYNSFNPVLHQSSPLFQMANDELKYNRLLTFYHEEDLERVLTNIYKNTKTSIEENGASTLYLAVGLLKWYDRKTPTQPRYAPILLLPVEINRRTVNSKFTLKNRGEETMINITLLEYLRQEFELNLSLMEQLPYDDKGIDVAMVMGKMRRAVMQQKGWDVEEQLVLGNFSFNKLILWKDITSHESQLRKSELVKSLIEGKLYVKNKGNNLPLDIEKIPSQSVSLPISADVMQMEAVLSAQNGTNFILHGPPGTGKSQTITNIIADAMYRGKRVLFVAAKKAALDVVHKRLEQVGLTPFTLELHSNKATKSHVLEQLSKTLETAKFNENSDFAQESLRLDEAKAPLNNYVNILHQKQSFGWSVYDSIIALENLTENNFSKDFIPEDVLQNLSATKWQKWEDWLPQFQTIIQLITHPQENPLVALNISTYSQSLEESISNQSKAIILAINDVENELQQTLNALHFPFLIETKNDWDKFLELIASIQSTERLPIALCNYLSRKENTEIFEDWLIHFEEYLSAKNKLLATFTPGILNVDLSKLEFQWKKANQDWFFPKILKRRKIRKLLSGYSHNTLSENEEVDQLFDDNHQLDAVQNILQQNRFDEVRKALKNLFKNDETNINDILQKAEAIKKLVVFFNDWEFNGFQKWTTNLLENNVQNIEDIKERNANLFSKFQQSILLFNESKKNYQTLTAIDFQHEGNWLQSIRKQIEAINEKLDELKNWIIYKDIAERGKSLQLNWLILAFENKKFESKDVVSYFYFITHSSVVQRTIAQNESLSLFNKNLFEGNIERFKKIAQEYQLLTIKEMRVKLSANLPNSTFEAMQSSEIGILQRAIKSRGRGLSIRKLFDQIPTLLPRLVPCMLMSPISVAQYFDANVNHFDLVIFDEASQLPTCEAVSAMARARQVIVVGDPKQMPPTNFFSSNKIDEDNADLEDLESILDDCLSLSVTSKYLLRHYRSKHESLIAFSNANYYENKLLTFPSSDDLDRKVKYHHITGYYDKGKTRTNKFEADAIVQFIINHYKDEQTRKLSLGVVTFSQVQQNLIEEKLNNEFATDAELESFATQVEEPLFIKNLENVQGDERDIILFSIGYAPDENGKLSMNFGPINREGGWRRLNVAVTRARYEMHIFATLRADQIDLSRTAKKGAEGLKLFLQFAEKGQLAVNSRTIEANFKKQHLSEVIRKQLMAKGLNVKCNIGTSDFKVDIGVVNPDKPEEYILGILIDGYYYYQARTSNDREIVMPSVLKVLGWNIYRIWTMDWLENAEKIVTEIVEKVKILQSKKQSEIILEKEKTVIPNFEEKQSFNTYNPINIIAKQKPYEITITPPLPNANSITIYEFINREKIKRLIEKIIFTEEPISKNFLCKRVLKAWNVSRAGSKMEGYLDEILKEANVSQTFHHQPFYWRANSSQKVDYYRNNDNVKRSLEDIAPEELAIAINEAVEHNLSIEEEELLRYVAKLFGFSKVGKQIEELLLYSIKFSIKTGKIKREGTRIKWV